MSPVQMMMMVRRPRQKLWGMPEQAVQARLKIEGRRPRAMTAAIASLPPFAPEAGSLCRFGVFFEFSSKNSPKKAARRGIPLKCPSPFFSSGIYPALF